MSRENFMIELSAHTGKDDKTVKIFINPAHIVAITQLGEGTDVALSNQQTHTVAETVEQIERKAGAYGVFKIIRG